MDDSSVQLTRRKAGSSEVEIETVDAEGNTGLIRLHHNSAGVFKPKNQSGEGRAGEIITKIQGILQC